MPRERLNHRLADFDASWSDWKRANGYWDFTDLLEYALDNVGSCPGEPAVLCLDEAQDSSRLQVDLLLKWGLSLQKLVLAGDPDQSIYQWAGADAEVLEDLARSVGPDHVKVLSQSHRVPRAVHAFAQEWIKKIDGRLDKPYAPRDQDGQVVRCAATWQTPNAAVSLAQSLAEEGKTVLILAACSYMLERTIACLKRQKLPYHNPYRRSRADWNPLIGGSDKQVRAADRVLAFLRPSASAWKENAASWSRHDFWLWGTCLSAKGANAVFLRGHKDETERFKNDFETLAPSDLDGLLTEEGRRALEGMMFSTEEECRQAIGWLQRHLTLTDGKSLNYALSVAEERGPRAVAEEPKIALGTIHSSKGGEADAVILYPDLSWPAWLQWGGAQRERDAVIRLFYVATTRAAESLYICDPAGTEFVPLMGG